MTLDVIFAGRRSVEIFGLPRGPWSVPSFSFLLRGADGNFGAAWWGWLLPAAALLALILCRGDRRRVATKLGDHRDPDADSGDARLASLARVVLTRYRCSARASTRVTLASLIGLGIGALEHDLRDAGFGWRQVAAVLSIATIARREPSVSFRVSVVDASICPPPASPSLSRPRPQFRRWISRALARRSFGASPGRLDGGAGTRGGHVHRRAARRIDSLQPAGLGDE